MKPDTTRQHTNAFMSDTGPKVWIVKGKWVASEETRVMHRGLTYRQAKATARAIREACGFAETLKGE